MCQVIVAEGLCDEAFIREQTDLALLVRRDNGNFLRATDLPDGGRADQFFFYDESTGRIAEAPRGTLDTGEVLPALEGEYIVATGEGDVAVSPLFQLLRERLRDYAPEEAAET